MAGFQGAWGKWICNRENGVLYYPQQKTVMEIRIMKRTFTLVEILVVVAIIGILAGMALGLTAYVSEKTARTSTQTTIKLVELALESYKNKFGYYPVLDTNGYPCVFMLDEVEFETPSSDKVNYKNNIWGQFNDVTADDSGNAKIRGIRIQHVNNRYLVLDGWRQPLIYVYPGVFNTGSYDLVSLGKDKTAANSGKKSSDLSDRDKFSTHMTNGEGDDVTNFKRD